MKCLASEAGNPISDHVTHLRKKSERIGAKAVFVHYVKGGEFARSSVSRLLYDQIIRFERVRALTVDLFLPSPQHQRREGAGIDQATKIEG